VEKTELEVQEDGRSGSTGERWDDRLWEWCRIPDIQISARGPGVSVTAGSVSVAVDFSVA
jgi:hypothetical protein